MYLYYILSYLLGITLEAKGKHEPCFGENPKVWLVGVGGEVENGELGGQEGSQSLCLGACS